MTIRAMAGNALDAEKSWTTQMKRRAAEISTALEIKGAEIMLEEKSIPLTKPERQSHLTRQKWAEGLIQQLPKDHDGRNSWLLNHGVSDEAETIRSRRGLKRCARCHEVMKREIEPDGCEDFSCPMQDPDDRSFV